MKNRFLNFWHRYWICFLLSVIMIIGLSLSTRYADVYKTGGLEFDLHDLYLIYGIPLYSFMYGCLTYTILKKVWIPQLVLFAIAFLYWFRYGIDALVWGGTYIWSTVPLVFSLIGAGITAFIYGIIKSIQENQNEISKTEN